MKYANTAIFHEASYLKNSCKQQIAMTQMLSRKLCLSACLTTTYWIANKYQVGIMPSYKKFYTEEERIIN